MQNTHLHDAKTGSMNNSEHVSDLSKADLIVLLHDLRAAGEPYDLEVIAACEKYGINPTANLSDYYGGKAYL